MKYVIEHSQTKRKIDGALNICGSREDLLWLARNIYEKVKFKDFYYGWISIEQRPTQQQSLSNTPVNTWDNDHE